HSGEPLQSLGHFVNRASIDDAGTLPRKKPNIVWWIVGFLFVVLFLFLFQLFGPSPQVYVSKKTTYITEPLRRDGLPDYERYLLEQAREGITPENNAAVLLVRALWPAELQPQDYAAVAKELGLAQGPSQGDAIVPLGGAATRARVLAWLKQTAGPQTAGGKGAGDT